MNASSSVGHPVSLGVANTTADAEVVRGWYRLLLAQGTLDRMVATELVDLVWIAGIAASAVLLTLLGARLLVRRDPRAAGLLVAIAPWTALAPGRAPESDAGLAALGVLGDALGRLAADGRLAVPVDTALRATWTLVHGLAVLHVGGMRTISEEDAPLLRTQVLRPLLDGGLLRR